MSSNKHGIVRVVEDDRVYDAARRDLISKYWREEREGEAVGAEASFIFLFDDTDDVISKVVVAAQNAEKEFIAKPETEFEKHEGHLLFLNVFLKHLEVEGLVSVEMARKERKQIDVFEMEWEICHHIKHANGS